MSLSKVPLQVSCRPLQVLEGYYKVFLEPSLLQTEQPQLSQPVFIGEVFQPLNRLGVTPQDQQVYVIFMLGASELNTDPSVFFCCQLLLGPATSTRATSIALYGQGKM